MAKTPTMSSGVARASGAAAGRASQATGATGANKPADAPQPLSPPSGEGNDTGPAGNGNDTATAGNDADANRQRFEIEDEDGEGEEFSAPTRRTGKRAAGKYRVKNPKRESDNGPRGFGYGHSEENVGGKEVMLDPGQTSDPVELTADDVARIEAFGLKLLKV